MIYKYLWVNWVINGIGCNFTGGLVLNIPAKLLAGGLAGAIAQSFSYPLDVTRRRMQLAMMDPETAKFGWVVFFFHTFTLISYSYRLFFLVFGWYFRVGMVNTLKHIYNENGIVRGLYRGMSINYLRAIPMVAVSFSTYELLKQALNLDTGMTI